MERKNEKPIELTLEQLDIVTGGKAGTWAHPPSAPQPLRPDKADPLRAAWGGFSRNGSARNAAR